MTHSVCASSGVKPGHMVASYWVQTWVQTTALACFTSTLRLLFRTVTVQLLPEWRTVASNPDSPEGTCKPAQSMLLYTSWVQSVLQDSRQPDSPMLTSGKAWITLYTCHVTCAIHLDIVLEMTTALNTQLFGHCSRTTALNTQLAVGLLVQQCMRKKNTRTTVLSKY